MSQAFYYLYDLTKVMKQTNDNELVFKSIVNNGWNSGKHML